MSESDSIAELASLIGTGKICFVIGAGASDYETFGVQTLRDSILSRLRSKKGGRSKLQKQTLKYLNKEPKECSLEELLSIYNEIYEEPINLFLIEEGIVPKSKNKSKYSLSFEILSHLMRHKVIDNIINFNFDECLEVSLNDEMGEEGYEWVRSKSIFQKINEDIEAAGDKLPSKPLLIKPHGTIGYSATIRPTTKTVQQFEKEKSELLEKVLSTASIIVILGYSCKDPDFQKVMKTILLTNTPKIFWVDNDTNFPEQNKFYNYLKEKCGENCTFIDSTSDSFLETYVHQLRENQKGYYPTIIRHKLRHLFSTWGVLYSIKEKLQFEIMLFAIKTRGMFSIEGLLCCRRIKNYCEENESLRKESVSLSVKQIFEEVVATGIFKKNEGIKTAEAYYIPTGIKLEEKILRVFNIDDRDNHKEKKVSALIENLMTDFDFDFGQRDISLCLKYDDFELIEDYGSLIARSKEVISSASEQLKIITETGEWIVRDEFKKSFKEAKKNGVHFSLILAALGPDDDSHRKVQEKTTKKLKKFFPRPNLTIKYLPWDLHNVHMTINEKGKGIYFHRPYKTPIFTPIYIHGRNESDSKILKEEFEKFDNLKT